MKNLLLITVCVFGFIACKKEKTEGPQGPQGSAGTNGTVPTGIIAGKITQADQYYNTYTSGLNSTTVSIDGTTISCVTNATGNYTLSNVPAGVYDISLIKNGCGLSKIQQVNFPGNGTLFINGAVSDKATYFFTGGYIKDSLQQIKIVLNSASINVTRQALIVFGKTAAIDINVPSSYNAVQAFYIFPSATTFSNTQPYSILDSTIFASGSTIYAKIYPDNSMNSGYNNYANESYIYTGCGTPLAGTFTLTRP